MSRWITGCLDTVLVRIEHKEGLPVKVRLGYSSTV